jgi:tetratricopeptide (TPR) repeat protein
LPLDAGDVAIASILEKLIQEFPDEPRYKDGLAWACRYLAWSTPDEEKWLRRAVDLWDGLVTAHPLEREYRRRLAEALACLHNPVFGHGRRGEAEMICRRAIAVMESAQNDAPRTDSELRTLGACYDNLGEALQGAGRLSEALASFEKCIDLQLPLAGRNAGVPSHHFRMDGWQWMNFGACHLEVADLLRRTGKCQKARPFVERAINIHKWLVDSSPKTEPWLQNLQRGYTYLGRLERACGNSEASDFAHKEAIRIAEQLSILFPAPGRRTLANFLLTCADPKFRDPQRALELLQNSQEWRELALANYRTRKYRQALEAAGQVKRGGSQCLQAAFIQAMAHWQLGDKDRARECYDEAERWLQANRLGDEILCQERDEAAALLGMN